MAEVVNDILSNQTRHIIADRGEKAAMQPEVTMTEDEKEAEKILAGGADFEFQLAYEVIPAIEIKDFSDIKVTRPVFDVPDDEIEDQVKRVAESARSYEPKEGKAADGDRVTIDYVGKIGGEAFEGGAGTGQPLVLGSKEFIPGFEDQLSAPRPATRSRSPSPSPKTTPRRTSPARKPPSTSPSRKCRSPVRSRSTTRRPSRSGSNRSTACARSCAARSRTSSAR